MEHMGTDSGPTSIFDDVDKGDFKADFGSEFPVGLTFGFLHALGACVCCLLLSPGMSCAPHAAWLLPPKAGVCCPSACCVLLVHCLSSVHLHCETAHGFSVQPLVGHVHVNAL